MNIGSYTCDAAEEALINKYGFKVYGNAGSFRVRCPGHKKLGTYSEEKDGKTLLELLKQAAQDADKLEAFRASRPTKVKATMTTTSKIPANEPTTAESVPPVVGEAKTETDPVAPQERIHTCPDESCWCEEYNDKLHQQTLETPPETISDVVLDDSGGKVRKPQKEKGPQRDPSKLKLLSATKLWLLYPEKEAKFIRERLTEQGIEAKDSSIEALRHTCANVVKAMVELGFITQVEIRARRAILVEQKNIPGLGDVLTQALKAREKPKDEPIN